MALNTRSKTAMAMDVVIDDGKEGLVVATIKVEENNPKAATVTFNGGAVPVSIASVVAAAKEFTEKYPFAFEEDTEKK